MKKSLQHVLYAQTRKENHKIDTDGESAKKTKYSFKISALFDVCKRKTKHLFGDFD